MRSTINQIVLLLVISRIALAEGTHTTPSSSPRPVASSAPSLNLAPPMPLNRIVSLLDSPIYSTRQLATNEINQRLLQNFQVTEQALRPLVGELNNEGKARIESLLHQSRVDWRQLFNGITAATLSAPSHLLAQQTFGIISARVQGANPEENHETSIKKAGFTIIKQEGIADLENMVIEKEGKYFRVQFHGPNNLESVTPLSGTNQNRFAPVNVEVNFGEMLSPLQRNG